jgi:oxygen-independent coproporphyrinogen III oxidase
MAGIYIHIPFCRKVCYYCDFFFTVSLKHRPRFIECLKKELILQQNYLKGEKIETIYFGGGTPSIIPPGQINGILNLIYERYKVIDNPEITLEANPDDLTEQYLDELVKTKVNRLSIGIQSFFDEDLKWMNRRHNGIEAINSIKLSKEFGFKNMNIDLIYGFPLLTNEKWEINLQKALELGVTHISSYLLGIEPKTVFGVMKEKGTLDPIDDEKCREQFDLLIEKTGSAGYIHYEISNFSLPGFFSRHNTSYWSSKNYLGAGPSANSYNGISRQWNVRGLMKYMESIDSEIVPAEREELDLNTRYNDYILTSLRTMWGVEFDELNKNFGQSYLMHFKKEAEPFVLRKEISYEKSRAVLTRNGMLVSDSIISSLFVV